MAVLSLKKNILLIDDEQDLIDLAVFRLEASGYKTCAALNSEEGLNKAISEKPDIILLDIMMPGTDGLTTLARLKDNEKTKHIPVIMFTSKTRNNDVSRAAELGAADYVVKPFTPQKLLEKIKKALVTP
ncbi:MAG: response regulator [Candidatus Omnitrophota bacterium]